MYCSHCGNQNADDASFCSKCGKALVSSQPSATIYCQACGAENDRSASGCVRCGAALRAIQPWQDSGELTSLGRRAGSWIIDYVLQNIPLLGLIPIIVNGVMFRRGTAIGLKIVRARIIRENGDVSGFFHTWVRAAASFISMIPLGLGFWWAFWDDKKQTWHDKIMHTYVMRDTPELAARKGSSSSAAVAVFWSLMGVAILGLLAAVIIPNVGRYLGTGEAAARDTELHNVQSAVIAMMTDNDISWLPNPVTAPTDDMAAFPDATAVAGSAHKATDGWGRAYRAGDKGGYLLFGHDITADGARSPVENYVTYQFTTCLYTVSADGIVTQTYCP